MSWPTFFSKAQVQDHRTRPALHTQWVAYSTGVARYCWTMNEPLSHDSVRRNASSSWSDRRMRLPKAKAAFTYFTMQG